jgi:magnesium chelatase family protein
MLAITFGAALLGVDAQLITIEVNISKGVNTFMVGLPDAAVKESLHRIDAAFKNNGYKFPLKGITINLAPANVKKEGSAFDLPIALGILAASGQINGESLSEYFFMGELALDGSLRPLKGILPMAILAREKGYKRFILPTENAQEAAIVDGIDVFACNNIQEAITVLETGKGDKITVNTRELFLDAAHNCQFDFNEVKGQENVKRAFEIAAAGGHNVLMVGPPGAGKTMLSKRLPSILPPLSLKEALETTKIHSVAGKIKGIEGLMTERPFRSPHHTISDVALVGGGSFPQPGEISLAHNGVLFLDELPEYKRTVLEVMRQPIEDRRVTIARSKFTVDYPASFMMVAAMNPCPCGYYNHPDRDCTCPPGTVQRYLSKVSGPLLDRIDIQIEVTPVNYDELSSKEYKGESSETVRKRVMQARHLQETRFAKDGIHANAQMLPSHMRQYCELDKVSVKLLKTAMERLQLSGRAYDRILKVSRTIADLEASENIKAQHIAEAIQYRNLDRDNWGNN